MKICSIEMQNYPPIKSLKIENIGDVVIIAGANGSGKTRIKQAIVQAFQGASLINLEIQATRNEERELFQNNTVHLSKGVQNHALMQAINNLKSVKNRYISSLIQVDSQRNIQAIKYEPVNYQISDPDENDVPHNFYHQDFVRRWQDFMTYIHKKVAAYQGVIAEEVKKNPLLTGGEILKKAPHPLEKYKKVFSQLLPGKELQDINPSSPREFFYRDFSGSSLPFSSLSSGEQEVVKIVFDMIRKDIQHSIIIIDEPELHLHPSLAFKLIETLKSIGNNTNQLIFLTHSADLISTYYSSGNVYYIDTDQSGLNQAHRLSDLNKTHTELVSLIGQNLGLIAVGKKLFFVEGVDSSVDRFTYHAIAQKYLPEAKIIPVGSVENIKILHSLEEQIRSSVFGVDFYMIRDRDGLSSDNIATVEASGRIKILNKRHIENYFLDPDILYAVVERFCLAAGLPHLTRDFLEEKIKVLASENLTYSLIQNIKERIRLANNFKVPSLKDVDKKEIKDVTSEMIDGVLVSIGELSNVFSRDNLEVWVTDEMKKLESALLCNNWQSEFHGKIIFSRLCGDVLKEKPLRIRQAYVEIALERKPEIFQDIIDYFQSKKVS